MNVLAWAKISLAFLIWVVGPALIGALIGCLGGSSSSRWLGLIAGMIVGVIYAVCGMMASDKLPIDLYEGRLMMREEDNDLVEIVEEIAAKAQIPAPDIYVLALEHPNVLSWASSNGKVGFSRIGISPELRSLMTPGEVQAAMAIAVMRIASGDAALLSRGASLAGLALHAVCSPVTNSTLGFMTRDLDTGLTPVGTAFMTLFAPICRLSLGVTAPASSWDDADRTAQRMLGSGAPVAASLKRLAGAEGLSGSGELRGYNPAVIGLYTVSPLERLVLRSAREAAARRAAKAPVATADAAAATPDAASATPSPPEPEPTAGDPIPTAAAVAAARDDRLTWSARVAAWISDVVPPSARRIERAAPAASTPPPVQPAA